MVINAYSIFQKAIWLEVKLTFQARWSLQQDLDFRHVRTMVLISTKTMNNCSWLPQIVYQQRTLLGKILIIGTKLQTAGFTPILIFIEHTISTFPQQIADQTATHMPSKLTLWLIRDPLLIRLCTPRIQSTVYHVTSLLSSMTHLNVWLTRTSGSTQSIKALSHKLLISWPLILTTIRLWCSCVTLQLWLESTKLELRAPCLQDNKNLLHSTYKLSMTILYLFVVKLRQLVRRQQMAHSRLRLQPLLTMLWASKTPIQTLMFLHSSQKTSSIVWLRISYLLWWRQRLILATRHHMWYLMLTLSSYRGKPKTFSCKLLSL